VYGPEKDRQETWGIWHSIGVRGPEKGLWFAELFFDPEDGGDTFLRNVGYNSTDYMASYPRRRYSSKPPL
jgi:hypothetical protein